MMKEFGSGLDFEKLEQSMREVFGEAPKTHLLDLHRLTAAVLNRVKYDQVTEDQRKHAKSLNFTYMYSTGYPVPKEEDFLAVFTTEQLVELGQALNVATDLVYQTFKARYTLPAKPTFKDLK